MDDYIKLLEKLIKALAKYGRHASILLCSNRTGYVKDSSGKVVFHFSNLEDLVTQLEVDKSTSEVHHSR
jgi:hypothetical protein